MFYNNLKAISKYQQLHLTVILFNLKYSVFCFLFRSISMFNNAFKSYIKIPTTPVDSNIQFKVF